MEALNVEPPVTFEVEDLAVCLVDLSVSMGPDVGLFEPEKGMHARAQQVCLVFAVQEVLDS